MFSTHLQFAGICLILLALLHGYFPYYFGWRTELSSLSLLTRQIFFVHHFFIALTVGLMGLLSLFASQELVETPLGRYILLGFGLFWFIRLLFQLFVYSSNLWRGKRFETTVHILFTLLWVYLSALYLLASLIA